MPLGTRNWGGTEYHDSIFDPESQPQEYEQPYVELYRTRTGLKTTYVQPL